MKRKGLYLLGLLLIIGAGCSTMRKGSDSDIVVLPLGGEVKVTEGSIVYALPLTVFEFDVIAEKTVSIPGPYAAFAEEMLGLDNVIREKQLNWTIGDISIHTTEELDPQKFYVIQGSTLMQTNLLALRRNGLVLDINPERYSDSHFSGDSDSPDHQGTVFTDMGADEYVSVRTDTAYKLIRADTVFVRIPYLVEKKKKLTLGEEAAEAAKKLLELREGRHMILTGETNIFPQDGAALKEINRLEREYTELFTGKSWTETKTYRVWFTPEPSMAGQKNILLRFSGTEGLLQPSATTGDPVFIELFPSDKTRELNLVVRPVTSEKEMSSTDRLYYRVPDVVDVRVSTNSEIICTARKLVYQFGNTVTLPENFIIGR